MIINKARYNWKIIRKRIKVIIMMNYIGEDFIKNMYQKKNASKFELAEEIPISKFIINPKNYWMM